MTNDTTAAGAPTRVDDISEILRTEILSGQYRVGERLPSERDLAVRFDANRGAVREALKRLEQLGVAHIQPGGARVAAIEEASLDVIGHLLGLGEVPNYKLVDEVLEVIGALMSIAVRRVINRGDQTELMQARSLLTQLRSADLDDEQLLIARMNLADFFMSHSDSLVLRLIAGSLGTQVVGRFPEHLLSKESAAPPRQPLLHSLDAAIASGDAVAASRAMSDLIDLSREQLHAMLGAAGSNEQFVATAPTAASASQSVSVE